MRARILAFVAVILMTLIVIQPALAHHEGHDVTSGRDFGEMVAEHARDGVVGQDHNPGMHQGFSGHVP